jgi:hypothetical protein
MPKCKYSKVVAAGHEKEEDFPERIISEGI